MAGPAGAAGRAGKEKELASENALALLPTLKPTVTLLLAITTFFASALPVLEGEPLAMERLRPLVDKL